MLDVLTRYLEDPTPTRCAVFKWILNLTEAEQTLFQQLREKSNEINVANLYEDLTKNVSLPFKLTAFRSHLRSYCTCR